MADALVPTVLGTDATDQRTHIELRHDIPREDPEMTTIVQLSEDQFAKLVELLTPGYEMSKAYLAQVAASAHPAEPAWGDEPPVAEGGVEAAPEASPESDAPAPAEPAAEPVAEPVAVEAAPAAEDAAPSYPVPPAPPAAPVEA